MCDSTDKPSSRNSKFRTKFQRAKDYRSKSLVYFLRFGLRCIETFSRLGNHESKATECFLTILPRREMLDPGSCTTRTVGSETSTLKQRSGTGEQTKDFQVEGTYLSEVDGRVKIFASRSHDPIVKVYSIFAQGQVHEKLDSKTSFQPSTSLELVPLNCSESYPQSWPARIKIRFRGVR